MSVFRRRGRPNWTKAEQAALAGHRDLERLVILASRPALQPSREALPQMCVGCRHHLFLHNPRHPLLACVAIRCRCRSYSPARP